MQAVRLCSRRRERATAEKCGVNVSESLGAQTPAEECNFLKDATASGTLNLI